MTVVPARKSTRVTLAAPTALAVAVMVVGAEISTLVLGVGEVIATLGAVTVTFTLDEVTTVPFESVTLAVRAVMPATVGVQLTV
jgi:hypothetical protein